MLYRQIAHKLRVQGRSPETSERPRHVSGCFLDVPCRREGPGHRHRTDAAPTLIELGPDDGVDIASLLLAGGIEAYTPPPLQKAPKALSTEEAPGGENRR